MVSMLCSLLGPWTDPEDAKKGVEAAKKGYAMLCMRRYKCRKDFHCSGFSAGP
jgi:hypothetical protein